MFTSRRGRSARPLALVLLALIAGLAALALVVGPGTSSEPTARSKAERAGQPGERPGVLIEGLNDDERAKLERAGDGAASSSPGADSAPPSGVLHLKMIDALTRAPVAGLAFLVYRERGGYKLLARGTTDADGRAEVRELEANTILVETERKPPHAAQTAGVWLKQGQTKDLELLLDAGATIVGRIVDDTARPVADVGIFLRGDIGGRHRKELPVFDLPPPPEKSGSDGRFRVECASSSPTNVWIVDGQMRPERWEDEWLAVTKDGVVGFARTPLRRGEVADVGDVVLARAARFTGRVVDARERPVAGALVSLRHERMYVRRPGWTSNEAFAHGPGEEGFHLFAREQLTDAAGAFELSGSSAAEPVTVWTREGQTQDFRLPKANPGERVEGIVFRLNAVTQLELELVDARGERLIEGSPAIRQPFVMPGWRKGNGAGPGIVQVEALLSDGKRIQSASKCGADGIWTLQLDAEPSSIAELVVYLPGYEPAHERVAGALRARERRQYTLALLPSLRIRLVPKDPDAKRLDAPGAPFQVHVCLAPPERLADPSRATVYDSCCGAGVFWNKPWNGEPREIVLPVRKPGAYWIHARSNLLSRRAQDVASFGPFETGDTLREISFDTALLEPLSQAERTVPPEPVERRQMPTAELTAFVVDARTGLGIARAHLHLGRLDDRQRQGLGAQTDEQGRVHQTQVELGRWSVTASSGGYREKIVGEFETRDELTLDLGTIALEALPRHRGKLLDAEGRPAAGIWLGEAGGHHEPPGIGPQTITEADGAFEFFGELPAHFLLQAGGRPVGSDRFDQAQRFVVDAWPEDEEKLLRLAPYRDVLVHVLGLDTEDGATDFRLSACPAPGEPTACCDHRSPSRASHLTLALAKELAPSPPARRFSLRLAPGRYQLWGFDLLHELPPTEIEVSAGESPLSVEISAR